MGRVDDWSHCTNCYHICHYNDDGTIEVVIGMTRLYPVGAKLASAQKL